ncbi:MAG TPA: glycosyl transferase family 2, partial [Terriglobia bacterium]|nr:glycosyl transferase family 2 [Terriglobia bacterium]
IGLTITNTCAVLEGLFGRQSEFVRTPKYRIEGRGPAAQSRFFHNVYRRRSHWVAALEILIGSYFVFAVSHALENENYATALFLCLFVLGYLGTGLFSLLQARWDWLVGTLAGPVAALRRPFTKGLLES